MQQAASLRCPASTGPSGGGADDHTYAKGDQHGFQGMGVKLGLSLLAEAACDIVAERVLVPLTSCGAVRRSSFADHRLGRFFVSQGHQRRMFMARIHTQGHRNSDPARVYGFVTGFKTWAGLVPRCIVEEPCRFLLAVL
jgi:hypothetical protein